MRMIIIFCFDGTWMKYDKWVSFLLAATLLWGSNTTNGVSAFWDCCDHVNMWVSFLSLIEWIENLLLRRIFWSQCFMLFPQLFSMLEQVWLAWSHSWNYWQKAGHVCKRGNVSFYRIIFMQVSQRASFQEIICWRKNNLSNCRYQLTGSDCWSCIGHWRVNFQQSAEQMRFLIKKLR